MVKRPSPLDIYKHFDKSNCKECGHDTCMAFATDLLERKVKLTSCTHMLEPKMKKKLQAVMELITPPQKTIEFGTGKRMAVIGGEEVIFRHSLTFFNKTAIAIEVHDSLPNLVDVVKYVGKVAISRIGEILTIDAVALRCVSGDASKFASAAKTVADTTDLPIILVSFDAKVLDAAAQAIKDKRPLLYAATKDNWKEVGKTAVTLQLPLVCFSKNLDELASLCVSLNKMGAKDLCVDPGTFHGEGLQGKTFDDIWKLRYAAIDSGFPEAAYPVIGVPATIWADKKPEDEKNFEIKYSETIMGTIMMTVDTSLIIMHTGRNAEDIWALLALMTYRQGVFTDPRIYPRVDAGLFKIGNPTRMSPIFVTTNYRSTKMAVEDDIKSGNIDSFLLVIDSNGIGVESAVVGGQFNATKIAEAIVQYKAFNSVDHRIVVIPGMAARYSGALEDEGKCYVCVGPRDSSGIPKWTKEKWTPDEYMKEFKSRGA
jgi:acetyl-CoA decarbonylase/synthase complex subunit gamma